MISFIHKNGGNPPAVVEDYTRDQNINMVFFPANQG
jgi:hypothetical protein